MLLSVAGGIAAGLFYPLLAKSQVGRGHLQPYTVDVVFSLGAGVSALLFGYLMMRKPVVGPRLSFKDYRLGTRRVHA